MKAQLTLLAVTVAAAAAGPAPARADGQPQLAAPPEVYRRPIIWEMGLRYWHSEGRSAKDLHAPGDPTTMVSRLTYDELNGQSGELFFRGDHINSRLFVKGFLGGGSINNGKLNDEDWPAGPVYSNTVSDVKNSNFRYFTVDLGYTFYDGYSNLGSVKDDGGGYRLATRLGAFVGYNYWREQVDSYGCFQVAVPSATTSCAPIGISTGTLSLGQDNRWNSLRLGLTGDMRLGRWKFTGDAAYLFSQLDGKDHHHFRPDIDPLPESGDGNGIQLEGIISYQLTEAFSLGVGARWWHIDTEGHAQFPTPGTPASPERWEVDRSGVFVQGSLKFQ